MSARLAWWSDRGSFMQRREQHDTEMGSRSPGGGTESLTGLEYHGDWDNLVWNLNLGCI